MQSSPRTARVPPRRSTTLTVETAMGFGLMGERSAKVPNTVPLRFGFW